MNTSIWTETECPQDLKMFQTSSFRSARARILNDLHALEQPTTVPETTETMRLVAEAVARISQASPVVQPAAPFAISQT
jgi:hypothetical protein